MLTKLNLEKQMQMEKAERKALKDIDKDYERQDADMIAAMHIEAKEHRKNQKKEAVNHFKAVWEAQKTLKEQNEAMENCF